MLGPDAHDTSFAGRRTSTIVAVRQSRDSTPGSVKRAGAEADQQGSELLDKANAYVDELKVSLIFLAPIKPCSMHVMLFCV